MYLRLISLEASICQATSSNIERHSLIEKQNRKMKINPNYRKDIDAMNYDTKTNATKTKRDI